MIRTFALLIFLFFNICYGCYSVSTSPTSECAKKGEFIQSYIDAGEFEPGSIGNTYQVPIYIKSDSKKSIKMKMPPIDISNNYTCLGQINAIFQSNITGNTVTFTKHKEVELLPKGYKSSRDGTTLIGYITFLFPDLSELQSEGAYSARSRIKLYENNKPSKSFKVDIYFSVRSILVVGLEDVSGEFGNKVFKYANIDLGSLDGDTATIKESDIYLKSNYDCAGVYLRFNNTPNLKHKITDDTIDMEYYYKKRYGFSYTKIRSGSEILLYYWGTLNGSTPVGRMRFVAAKSKGKTSGEYGAVVSVTVSVQ